MWVHFYYKLSIGGKVNGYFSVSVAVPVWWFIDMDAACNNQSFWEKTVLSFNINHLKVFRK